MSYSIQCLHCSAVLTAPAPIPAGKAVKCPKCAKSFTTPAQGQASANVHSITCAHCQTVLKSPTPLPAGKNVTCPKCNQSFTTPGTVAPVKTPTLTPPSTKPAAYSAPASMNISIFSGDTDAAIANLSGAAGVKKPDAEPDLPECEEDEETEKLDDDLVLPPEPEMPADDGVIPFEDSEKKAPKKKTTW